LKVGVLGGTFDPVHNAHLAIARAALAQLDLDQLIWIPTGATAYRAPAAASGEHRLAMLRLALAGEPRYAVDGRELAPGATGYTADTLKSLRGDLGAQAEIYLLMGGDQYAKLDSWHRPDEVMRLATIVLVERPGWKAPADDVRRISIPPMTVTASDIRARAARGEDLSALVPAPVANYISRHGLYR